MPIVKSTTPTIKIKQGITANYEKAIITLKNLKGDTIKKENPVNIDGIFEVDLSQTDTQTLGAGLVKFEIQYFYTDGTTNIEINGKIYMHDSFSDGKATATGGIDDEKIYTAELIFDTLVNTTRGIVDIKKTATSGLIDTYTITYTDDTTSTFEVTNGEKGDTGKQGIQGEQGVKGDTGATYELTDSDKEEIAEITQEDATSLFNQNVSEKTTTFEKLVSDSETEITDLATAKEQSLTDLSTTKENSLTSLATTLMSEFNANATTKTNIFDSNAEEKTSDFNAVVTSANEIIDEKVATVESLAEDIDNAIVDYVGDTEDLTTNDKTNIVNPINEVNSLAKANKSELEKARESFLGDLYEDLYARLMADFSAVYDRFNEACLVPYSDTFINASNTYVGLTSGTEIKGVTQQNQYYIQTVEDSVVQFDDGVGEYAVVTSDVDCTLTRCGRNLLSSNNYDILGSPSSSLEITSKTENFTQCKVIEELDWFFGSTDAGLNFLNVLKPNSKYTIQLKNSANWSVVGIVKRDGTDFLAGYAGFGGRNYVTVTTNSLINTINNQVIYFYTTPSSISINDIFELEDVMFEIGDVKHDYEPYTGETYTLTANTPTQIPLLEGTNTFFCDTGDNLTVRYLTETETEETTPNVDFPQEMSSVEGDLVVKSVGKNLYPNTFDDSVEWYPASSMWCSLNKELGFYSTGRYKASATKFLCKAGVRYYLDSRKSDCINITVAEFKVCETDVSVYNSCIYDTDTYIVPRYNTGSNDTETLTVIANPIITIDSSTDYEPYTEDTITYNNITLRSLPNGVCDSIENGQLVQRVGERAFADGDYSLPNIYTDGVNTLYQLEIPTETPIDTRELRTYDGVTNIFTTGTDVMPIISTNIPSNIGAVVADQSNTIASQANTITEQASTIVSLTNELSSVQEQSNDTDDVLNELIGGESV